MNARDLIRVREICEKRSGGPQPKATISDDSKLLAMTRPVECALGFVEICEVLGVSYETGEPWRATSENETGPDECRDGCTLPRAHSGRCSNDPTPELPAPAPIYCEHCGRDVSGDILGRCPSCGPQRLRPKTMTVLMALLFEEVHAGAKLTLLGSGPLSSPSDKRYRATLASHTGARHVSAAADTFEQLLEQLVIKWGRL